MRGRGTVGKDGRGGRGEGSVAPTEAGEGETDVAGVEAGTGSRY